MPPIDDHPLRYQLTNELHARPFPSVAVPATAVFLAVKRVEGAAGRDRDADLQHLLLNGVRIAAISGAAGLTLDAITLFPESALPPGS